MEREIGINKRRLLKLLEDVDDNATIYINFTVDREMFVREISEKADKFPNNEEGFPSVFLRTVDFGK